LATSERGIRHPDGKVQGPRRNFKVGIGKEELREGLKNYARLDILGVKGMIVPQSCISADRQGIE
jgi:hypothetical protein